MGSQTILLLCIGLSAVQIVHGQVWEFGSDNIPSAVLISQYNGKFSFFQKEQHIQLIVPACHIVTYVNVKVENTFSSPTVYYNYETNIVTIHYSLWQISPSTYTISAKAVWQQGCYVQPPVPPVQGQQVQHAPQGQFAPQGRFAPQSQFASQSQFAPQGQLAPDGQFAPQGQFPPQGQFAPQGQFPPQGQFAPQGQQGNQYRQSLDDPQIPQDEQDLQD